MGSHMLDVSGQLNWVHQQVGHASIKRNVEDSYTILFSISRIWA